MVTRHFACRAFRLCWTKWPSARIAARRILSFHCQSSIGTRKPHAYRCQLRDWASPRDLHSEGTISDPKLTGRYRHSDPNGIESVLLP